MSSKFIAVSWVISAITVACTGRSHDGAVVVNLDKPSSKKINLKEYCESIELIPLGDVNGLKPESKLSVFDRGFIIQNDSTCLNYFDDEGSFQRELQFDDIADFSTFRNERLFVLTPGGIEIYGLKDLSYEGSLPLPDTSFTYCKVGGKDDHSVVVLAVQGGRIYSGEYDIPKRVFYFPADGGMKGGESAMKKMLDKSGFFYSESESYFFYSNTGEVYRMADFYFLSYYWDFKHREPVQMCVSNVQKTTDKLFMQIETNKDDYCLITELEENGYPRSSKLYSNTNTPCFPLGVFYGNVNHFLCNSSEMDQYVDRELLDDKGKATADSLRTASCNLIIKYHLK